MWWLKYAQLVLFIFIACTAADLDVPFELARPHNDPDFFETLAMYATVDSVMYETAEVGVKNVPYSGIRGIQKTKNLMVLCPKNVLDDSNQMLEMCTRVRQMFVHLHDIGNIEVVGSMPSECFELSSPMNTVKTIKLSMYDVSSGFPFDQFKSTERVYIKANTPIMAIDSLWGLREVTTLRILMMAPARFTPNDELASDFIKTAKRLNELELDACGTKTFAAITAANKEGRLSKAKFVHKTITTIWKEKKMSLQAASSFNVLDFGYEHLPLHFEKITAIGRVDVAEPELRYNTKWNVTNHKNGVQFSWLGWYIFVGSERVLKVDLTFLKINDIFDSFWFVYNSIGAIPNHPCSHVHPRTVLENNLYVSHDTSDTIDSDEGKNLLATSMNQVKKILKEKKHFKNITIYELKDGKIVNAEQIYLRSTIFG